MISERTFLMKIFARKDATDEMREMIIIRCEELDECSTPPPQSRTQSQYPIQSSDPILSNQSPSMQRLMQANPDLIPKPPVPSTPAAAQALASYNALRASAGSEKPEAGRRAPRKA